MNKVFRSQYLVASVFCLKSTHLTQWQVMILLLQEVDVSRRDDAHQLAAHFAVVCDGDSAEAVASLGLEHVPYPLVGAHHHRVRDEALLITLGEGGTEGREENKEGQEKDEGRIKRNIMGQKRESNRREKGLWDSVSDGLIKNMKTNWKSSNLLCINVIYSTRVLIICIIYHDFVVMGRERIAGGRVDNGGYDCLRKKNAHR